MKITGPVIISFLSIFITTIAFAMKPDSLKRKDIDFSVQERAGVARHNEHILASIPFAKESCIYDVDNLKIVDKEAEFTVLSRYGGAVDDTSRPVRVVLADFQDDFRPGQKRKYHLASTGGQPPSGPKLVTEHDNYVEINTGSALFRISKEKGNLFERVQIGKKILVDQPDDSGMSVIVNDQKYSSFFSKPAVEIFRNGRYSAVIVVRGKLKNQKKQDLTASRYGESAEKKRPDSPVEYAFYYTFFKGKNYVLVEQTLKNNGRGWCRYPYDRIKHLYLNIWQTNLELAFLGNYRDVIFQDYSEKNTPAKFILAQEEKNSHGFDVQGYDFSASLHKEGKVVKKWQYYDGFVAAESDGGGVMTGEKWFWQNYPNAWSLDHNKLTSVFLPKRTNDYNGFTPPSGFTAPDVEERYLDNGDQYRMLGGMWKTHRTVYYFYDAAGPAMYKEVLAALQEPLRIDLSTEYWGRTNFFGTLFDANFTVEHFFPAGEKLQDAIDRWRNYAKSIWDPGFDNKYSVAFSTHRKRRKVPLWSWVDTTGTKKYTYPSWYGWLRFGGSPRALNFGFNNQHYDFSWQAYLVSQREQYYPAFKLYEELVEHLADVLTLHDPDAKSSSASEDEILLHGAQRAEQDALCDNYPDRSFVTNDPFVGNAHSWTKGVFLYYLLTGSPRYKEVLDSYQAHVQSAKMKGQAQGEIRDISRLIGAALNYWDVFGDPAALEDAWDIWQRLEGHGFSIEKDMFVLDSRIRKNKLVWIVYDSMSIPYIIRLYYALQDAGMEDRARQLKEKLFAMANWNKNMVLTAWDHAPGSYENHKRDYYKYTATNALYIDPKAKGDLTKVLPYRWGGKVFNANYSLSWCNLYAFVYRMTGEKIWLTMARTAFKDRFMYNFFRKGQLENPKKPFWQPYGIPFPGSSGTWKFGMAIILPLFYLQTEQWLQAGWTPATLP